MIVVILLIFVITICAGISVYVGWNLTHPARKALDETPADYGLSYDEIAFPSRSGDVELSGWFLPAAAGSPARKMTLIFAHGYASNRLEKDLPALELARSVVEAGYNVVMFDFRNSGQSGGKLTSVGYFEKGDLLGAVDWVKARHPGSIGVIGFSMGAVTALLAAAEEPDIAAVVADSPFANLKLYLQKNLPVWSNLPNFPFTPLIMTLLPPLTGFDPAAVNALAAVDRIYPRPILFIHGVADPSIPYTNSEQLRNSHRDKFLFWKTESDQHIASFRDDPVQYSQRVLDFFKNAR